MVGKYKVITLCGSTRFKDEFMEAQKKLTLAGNIVISVGLFGHSGDNEVWDGMDAGTLSQTKAMLDDMHKRKIDMADDIYVINKDGYIGDSTRSEIRYAREHGKTISYFEDRSIALKKLVDLRKRLQKSEGGHWRKDEENDGSSASPIQMPYVELSTEMGDFIHRVNDVNLIYPEFELNNYKEILSKNGIGLGSNSLISADVSKLDMQGVLVLMLGAIRTDRFIEGILLALFKNGSIDRWLRRLQELISVENTND